MNPWDDDYSDRRIVSQKGIRLYASERGLSGVEAFAELKDWLRWHERMRLLNDLAFRAWRVRGWREWLGDVTYKQIRWRIWRTLETMYLIEWPEGHALRGWDWFRCLRLRWWLVMERERKSDDVRDREMFDQERQEAWNRGFDDGAQAQMDMLKSMWESPHRPTDEEVKAINAEARAKFANPYE